VKDNSRFWTVCRPENFVVKGGNVFVHVRQFLRLQESGFVETLHREQGLNQEGNAPSNVLDEPAVCGGKRWQ